MGQSALKHNWRAGLVVACLGLIALVLGACGGAEDTGGFIHQTLATGDVGINEFSTAPPGTSEILPRDYPGAPAYVPHSLNGLTIDNDINLCVSCHATGLSFGEGHTATVIPLSHYTDQVDWTVTDELQDLRYDCLLCHLPQSKE